MNTYKSLFTHCCYLALLLGSSQVLSYDPVFKQHNLLTKNLSRGIYGNDDRKEYYELSAEVQAVTRSIPALVFSHELQKQGNSFIIKPTYSGKKYHLCVGEPFYSQPAAAYCSGFMVGPDLIATAGHCVIQNVQNKKPYLVNGTCDNISIVFDYRLNYKGDTALRFPETNVYRCKKVITRQFNNLLNEDYAVIQVDRPITERQPLPFRNSGHIRVGDSVTTIGYPLGIPIKVSAGATVRSNNESNYFTTDLDTFHGNSGGPVLDTASLASGIGRVEGILVRGPQDLQLDTEKLCYLTKICGVQDAMNRTCWGEQVSRISAISQHEKLIQTRPVSLLSIRTRNTMVQLHDELKINLNLPQAGYLTVIEVNPQGQYTVLFPNREQQDNLVKAGQLTLTNNPKWKLQVQSGPFGQHQLYAILSAQAKNLYDQNKLNQKQLFAPASINNLSALSRGAHPAPKLNTGCAFDIEHPETCFNQALVTSTQVCYYQHSTAECR